MSMALLMCSLSCTGPSPRVSRLPPIPRCGPPMIVSLQQPRVQDEQLRSLIRCQAHPRRVAKVTKQIEREIGSILQSDKVILNVTKNRTSGKSLCSCSGVEVSNDLQVVKVFLTVFTESSVERHTILKRMKGLSGYVRRLIGERVRLRLTPEVRFVHDVAVARGERVLSLLKKMEEEERGTAQENGASSTRPDSSTSDGSVEGEEIGDESTSANPFMEGVGDERYDEDVAEDKTVRGRSFFSADMFPDAEPELDKIAAAKKAVAWEESRKAQGKVNAKNMARKR